MTDVKLIQNTSKYPRARQFDLSHMPDHRAQLVLDLLKTQPLLQGRPDGQTDSGHPIIRPATPQEIVDAVFEVANLTWAEFEKRGMLVEVVFPEEPGK